MWARFTVLNETPIASAIAGGVIPLSRSNTIWMRSRCAAAFSPQRCLQFSNLPLAALDHLAPRIREPKRITSCPSLRGRKIPLPVDSISYGPDSERRLLGSLPYLMDFDTRHRSRLAVRQFVRFERGDSPRHSATHTRCCKALVVVCDWRPAPPQSWTWQRSRRAQMWLSRFS